MNEEALAQWELLRQIKNIQTDKLIPPRLINNDTIFLEIIA